MVTEGPKVPEQTQAICKAPPPTTDYPLQQYLIEFPGGRLQTLDIGWDSRPKEQGGQRWFHLHPDDPVRQDDVLHWTGPNLNWNYMCADCHSTNLRKGYDASSDTYHTTWSEIDVSCEACHGPGSKHVEWAEAKAKGEPSSLPDMGLTVRLRIPGDAVCYQCHPSDRYATSKHHFHAEGSVGASCVECHMPPSNYMVVDARHDHSFRVPRPDQTITLGTPNACNKCHEDKTPQWAADRVETWYGKQSQGYQHYARALHAAREQQPGAGGLLQAIAADADQPAIARATALQELRAYPDSATLALIQQELSAEDPLERIGALGGLESYGAGQRVLAVSLLWDDRKAVRIAAARLLTVLPPQQLPK
jgi:hypothetical protein